jgi:DNA-binding GntR family transcriptional regulator
MTMRDDQTHSRRTSGASPARLVTKSLQHRTMSAAVADELRRRILDGEFPAGFQLRQDALAEEFGVSRIPVREALMQIEAEGLVKIHPHRGAIVSELSLGEIDELFELRMLLEPRLLKASAPRLNEEDFRGLNRILDEYGSELRAQHVGRWGELNTEFHTLMYRHAEQPRSLAIVANLLRECDRHTRLQLSLTGGMERAEREHRQLVDLCAEGKVREACALLKAHIDHVRKSLRDFLLSRPTM